MSQFLIGVGAVFLGRVNDRFGPRVLMMYVGIMVGLGYFLMSQANSVWQLYLFQGIIVGIGISGTDVGLLSTTARWFTRKRGTMSGVAKMGSGVGFVIWPLTIAWLINAYGWRGAYGTLGVAVCVVAVLAAQLLKRDPAKLGQLPDGDTVKRAEDVTAAESGYTLRQAMRTRAFWLLCLSCIGGYATTFAVIVHFAQSVVDLEQTAATAARMMSIVGGAGIAGRVLMGMLNDKLGSKGAVSLVLGILSAAFLWLLWAEAVWQLAVFAAAFGFCHGAYYTLISPLVAEYFGIKRHGTNFGVVVFFGSIGGALGPWLTGGLHDMLGSYTLAFQLLLGITLAALGLLLLARRQPPPCETGIDAFTGAG